jgi:hypothetical protein
MFSSCCFAIDRSGGALYRYPAVTQLIHEIINCKFTHLTMSTSMPELPKTNEGKRICQVIKVKPEALEEYKKVDIHHIEG